MSLEKLGLSLTRQQPLPAAFYKSINDVEGFFTQVIRPVLQLHLRVASTARGIRAVVQSRPLRH